MSLRTDQDPRIEELLGRYVEELVAHGTAPDPRELCRGSPELLVPLRQCVDEYHRLDTLLAPPRGLVGRTLLHYRILDQLGVGGMGEVYLAEDSKLGRRVALKVLPPAMADDPERLARLRREARAVAALNHPNVVTLFAVEEAGDMPFLTMELVEGETLAELLPEGGFEPGRIVELAEQLASALEAAHDKGIVHRDLKPKNLMVGPGGRLKVLDFGLAKLRHGEEEKAAQELTAQGRLLGTVPYMSPEQVKGTDLDPRTDLFSTGVILYEMAVGERPFKGRHPAEIIASILGDEPKPLCELRPGVPPGLERIVLRLLEKDREKRYPSARAFLRDLGAWRRELESGDTGDEPDRSAELPADAVLRRRDWPPPETPPEPYPVLLPYTHPDLLGGRQRELAELRDLVRTAVPILGLYAPSGVGKSSLLAGGLVPALRAERWPVAFDRHPDEPGLARRLVGDLLVAEPPSVLRIDDGVAGHGAFASRLLAVRRLTGVPPVLVLDQLEDLFRRPHRGHARAVLGALLAAAARRRPGLAGPLCRFVLAYRQEFHGEVWSWLGDVLREARAEGLAAVERLPHDLSGPERFRPWPLAPLGTPEPRSADRSAAAARAFEDAITRPLRLRQGGEPVYRYRFAGDGAARLALAFAAARLARPAAPLVPELQVVLAHLLAQAGEPGDAGTVTVEVPAEPGELVDRALEEHLRRALDTAFPAGRTAEARTRALLALRELADVHGRRDEGAAAEVLAQAMGEEGGEALEKLATPSTRLVVAEKRAGGFHWVLAHDRLAEVLVRVVDGEGSFGRLGVDPGLLALRRFVVLNTELYLAGELGQTTHVPRDRRRSIEEHAGVLLWSEDRRRWWAACRERQRIERWRKTTWRAALALVLALVVSLAWTWSDRRARRRALLEQVAAGKPEVALDALDRLAAELPANASGADLGTLYAQLRRRDSPTDLFEHGLRALPEDRRGTTVLRLVEIAMPLAWEAPDDLVRIANLAWALDYAAGRDPRTAEAARALRQRLLRPLRHRRPPPPAPASGDPEWVVIPGGTFDMGSRPGQVPEHELEREWLRRESPQHRVTVSPFRMLRHEVTHLELRRLLPEHTGDDDLPAIVSWYVAYAYAAWLGGRLPTEAEWEYAARAGCPHAYCTKSGAATTVGQVAWILENNPPKDLSDQDQQPVMRLEPNPWSLYDMYGNVAEWVADWWGDYPTAPERDPWGPPDGRVRVERGAACWYDAATARAAFRKARDPSVGALGQGIRVTLPATDPATGG